MGGDPVPRQTAEVNNKKKKAKRPGRGNEITNVS